MLEVQKLHVTVDGKKILTNLNLQFEAGKVHVLMGPNGAGKSTLLHALMGHPRYTVTSGKIILDKDNITNKTTDERAKAGLFLSFQHPVEIPGVKVQHFLRTAYNNLREARGEKPLNVLEFHTKLHEKLKLLKLDESFGKRAMHEGFSGGERKRMEILQLLLFEPRYAFLDETDSGLDVDGIKTVAEGVNLLRKNKNMGIIVVTHYQRFLEYLKVDTVSVLVNGQVVAQGGAELALKIEKEGFVAVTK